MVGKCLFLFYFWGCGGFDLSLSFCLRGLYRCYLSLSLISLRCEALLWDFGLREGVLLYRL